MTADIFIKKGASVDYLICLYDKMNRVFENRASVKILCHGSVLTITIDSEVSISGREIYETAGELGWIIKDIVWRQ